MNPDVERILDLYRRHPLTTGVVRRADRLLASDLYRQGVDIETIRAALLLVAARCAQRPNHTIRSLNYFLPAIRELREQPLDLDYLRHLERRLGRCLHHSA